MINTILIQKCPICNSKENSYVLKSHKNFSMVQCKACFHYYTLISTEIESDKLYLEGDYEDFDARDTIFEKIIDFENKRILKKIEKLTNKRKLLDFGCGKGKFLKIAKSRNWESYGVETSLQRANYAKNNYGLEISTDYYNTGKIGTAPYEVITLFHVLEHISNPEKLLNNLTSNNLNPNGILLIEVPNFKSLQSKFAGSNWLHLDIPRHINHFTLGSLKSLMERTGLEIIKIEYYHNTHGILGMLNSLLNLTGYKKNIMSELKYRKNIFLIILIILLIPISFIFEIIPSILKKGSVLRIFAKLSN